MKTYSAIKTLGFIALLSGGLFLATANETEATGTRSLKCDCYLDGYSDGAFQNRQPTGRLNVPERCLSREAMIQSRGRAWDTGYGYGLNLESRAFAKSRAQAGSTWVQHRKAEDAKLRRLLCGS
jgi:hypothetical protein